MSYFCPLTPLQSVRLGKKKYPHVLFRYVDISAIYSMNNKENTNIIIYDR